MTLAVVVLGLGWNGYRKAFLDEISENDTAQMTSPFPKPPLFWEAGLMPFLLVGKGRYVISFKALCQLLGALNLYFLVS